MAFVIIFVWLLLLSAVTAMVVLEKSRASVSGRLVRPIITTSLVYWGGVVFVLGFGSGTRWADVAVAMSAALAMTLEATLRAKT